MDCQINDVRTDKDFRLITFSGFKKSDVHKEYVKAILESKIEPSLFWACELISAGHLKDLWSLIIYVFTKHVHTGNPKLSVYLDRRLCNFIDIIKNGYMDRELHARNNNKIRKLFAEITCVLCLSKKKHPYEEIKIHKDDFNDFSEKLVAPLNNICFKNDPKQLFLPLNELTFALTEGDTINSCYWVSWIVDYECICRNKKIKLNAENRSFIDSKYRNNVVWMIWDVFFHVSETKNTIVNTIVTSLFNIFIKRYSHTENKRKIFLLYFVVSLLTEIHDYSITMIEDSDKITSIVDNIDTIYKQVKTNEVSPNTDYLFKDVKQTNLEKTIERLETMENMTNKFIPRL